MHTSRIHKNNLSYESKKKRQSSSSGYPSKHGLIKSLESMPRKSTKQMPLININIFSKVFNEGVVDSKTSFIDKLREEIFGIRSLFVKMRNPDQQNQNFQFNKNTQAMASSESDFHIHEALLSLQSWWERIRKLRFKNELTFMSSICISLPEDINCFTSVYKSILNIDGNFSLCSNSNIFLDKSLYSVLLGIIGSLESTDNIRFNLSINREVFDISELSTKDKTRIVHIIYSYTFLVFAGNIFQFCGKNIDIPKWEIFNTENHN